MGMAIMWRTCTVSAKQCPLHVKPLGEMIAERFGVHSLQALHKGRCDVDILRYSRRFRLLTDLYVF